MARKEAIRGKKGENKVAGVLRGRGFVRVEPIGTPVILRTFSKGRYPGVFHVKFGQKVSGDHRALLPDKSGRAVLVETKTIIDRDTLRWSDMRTHQPERLDLHVEENAVVLLAWVHRSGTYLMQWPVPGYAPRKSIKLATAKELNIESAWQFCGEGASLDWIISIDQPCPVCAKIDQ